MFYLSLLVVIILLIPQQFQINIYSNIIFWIAIILSLIFLPQAFIQIKSKFKDPIVLFFLLYLGVLFLSALFSIDLFTTLPILLLNTSFLIIFLAAPKILNTYKSQLNFALAFIIVVTLLSAISFCNTIFKRLIDTSSEGLSFMWVYWGHNHLAVLLLIAIPLSIFFTYRFYRIRALRIHLAILIIFFLYSLLITFSRAAAIALLITILLSSFLLKELYWSKINKKIKLLLLTLVIIVALIASVTFLRKFPTGFESRIFHWQKGVEIFINNPILGTGPGTFSQSFKYPQNINFATAAYPMNLFVQIASETGILGLVAAAILYGAVVYRFLITIKETKLNDGALFYAALAIGLIAVILNEQLDFDMQIPSMGLLFWLLTALVIDKKGGVRSKQNVQ